MKEKSAILKIKISTLKIIFLVTVLFAQHVQPITIRRSESGDAFDNIPGSRECSTKRASCVDDRCQRCKCGSHATYFKQLCYPDLAHTALSESSFFFNTF